MTTLLNQSKEQQESAGVFDWRFSTQEPSTPECIVPKCWLTVVIVQLPAPHAQHFHQVCNHLVEHREECQLLRLTAVSIDCAPGAGAEDVGGQQEEKRGRALACAAGIGISGEVNADQVLCTSNLR